MTKQMLHRASLRDALGVLLDDVLRLVSHSDLSALSLVSKASRATTEPLLYTDIEWVWRPTLYRDQNSPSMLHWQEPQLHPIAAFLRTILSRPELAAYVRRVALLGDVYYDDDLRPQDRCSSERLFDNQNVPKISIARLDLDFFNTAMKAIKATKVSCAHLWDEGLRSGTMDAFTSLLLSQLYNLRHLALGENTTHQCPLTCRILTSALCNNARYRLPTFQHLREVTYGAFEHLQQVDWGNLSYYHDASYHGPKFRGKKTRNVLPFFYLPELQHLSVVLDNPRKFSWPMSTPPHPSTITSLELTLIREKHLSHLLSVTPHLKTLRWVFYHCDNFNWTFNPPLIDLNDLGAAMVPVRSTLKELTISARFDMGSGNEIPHIEIRGALTALAKFDQLEKIEIPLEFLTASYGEDTAISLRDVVPTNVRFLTITDDLDVMYNSRQLLWEDTHLYNHIAIWLRDQTSPKPNLHTVSLVFNLADEEWNAGIRQAFIELCNQYEITAKITKKNPDEDSGGRHYMNRDGLLVKE